MSIFYGRTNIVEKKTSGLQWNIMTSKQAPTSSTPGQVGDVIIITEADVEKIKTIVTKDVTDPTLQDNAINVFEDFSKNKILVNSIDGFNVYLQAYTQNIKLNGESIIAIVYFYDGLTRDWIQYPSAYRDNLSVRTFTGQDLDSIFDELWPGIAYTDQINENSIITPIIRQQLNDSLDVANFTGTNLDIDSFWGGPTITGNAILRTSNFLGNDELELS